MGSFTHDDAVLVAATEVLPAEWRDLSDLLEQLAEHEASPAASLIGEHEVDGLRGYLGQALLPEQIDHWQHRLDILSVQQPDAWLAPVTDFRYPRNLHAVYDRPPFLFVRGTLTEADRRAIAIVGSRDSQPQALEAAALLARAAAAAGITVVSGLALGVDAAAHTGALAGGGRTIAVLGTGIDRIYPPQHASLAAQITTQGAVVSQFRPGSPGTKSSFPLRNAVISGLSLVSVLMDARERSGTRSEAEAALRHSRPVLLWKPVLGTSKWAADWVAGGPVDWATSLDDVLAAVDPH